VIGLFTVGLLCVCVCVLTEQASGGTGLAAPKPISSMYESCPDELPLGETERQGPRRTESSLFVKNWCAALLCLHFTHFQCCCFF